VIKLGTDYFDRLLRRGRYNPLAKLRDHDLQQIVRDCKRAERVAPTVDDEDEIIGLQEQAKDELANRYPTQEVR
jgi:hypothetical protein